MQQFAIGQRWLSDTESELGLGVLIDVDERTLSILFPKSDETRVYSKKNAPLSRIIFHVGDHFQDQEGHEWFVDGVEQQNGVVRYIASREADEGRIERTLNETRIGAHIHLARPLERLLASQIDNKDWFDLRIEALMIQNRLATNPLRGLLGARVGLIPHQLYIAHEVGRRLSPRVLLADEVGLGKTIEAGLIVHQQLKTMSSERILVLVPDSLQYQWMIEMRRRFNLKFSLFDLVRTAAIREHDPDLNPFLTEQCIIASIDLLIDHPDLQLLALEAGFDLLVVDEAHHLTWDEVNNANEEYSLVEKLAKQTPGLLLLTATPEQLGVESHFARLRLLDPDRFQSLERFLDQELEYKKIAEIAESLMQDQNMPLDNEKLKLIEQSLGHPFVDNKEGSRQQAILELLDRHGTGRVLFRNTREAIQGFPGRDCRPVALEAPESWPKTGSLKQQMWPEESQLDGQWLRADPRVPWIIELLKAELKHKKVLLIARSGSVVEALETALRMQGGIRTAMFTEFMSLLERDQAAAYFAEEISGAQILLCSEIGSEGRNFQFASDLILFDLPTNPDTLEQRIGRLDRIGQQNRIQLHVPYLADTAQERMFRWYHEGCNIFSQISPTAQNLQENYIIELKQHLLECSGKAFDELLEEVAEERQALEAELQLGRDRLLEYNSCRPVVANRIVKAMEEHDEQSPLAAFMTRFMSSTNIDFEGQPDGTIIIRPSDHIQIQGLDLDEDGLTATFYREEAQAREDAEYLTLEHPLIESVFESIKNQSFGSTNVCVLNSNALPAGCILAEVWFKIEAIAPKVLNLAASLPQQLVRILIAENGKDLSKTVTSQMLAAHLSRLDVHQSRQIVKARTEVIESLYQQAETIASSYIPAFSQEAKQRYQLRLQKEIDRLEHLKQVNPMVRQEEIEQLKLMQQRGLVCLDELSVVPDALRIMVVMNPQKS